MFLLVYTLLLLSFSLTIWLVLYKIPDRHGLISRTSERLAVDEKLGDSEITDTAPNEDSKNPLEKFMEQTKIEEKVYLNHPDQILSSSPRVKDLLNR